MPPRPDRFPCPGGEALPLSCDVQPGDLSADLSIDVVRAGDRPFGVVVGEIRARLPDGSRVIRVLPAPETEEDARRIGQELDLWVAPSAVQLPRRLAFVPRRIRHWRFGWSAGAGLCHDALNRTAPCVSVTWGVQF